MFFSGGYTLVKTLHHPVPVSETRGKGGIVQEFLWPTLPALTAVWHRVTAAVVPLFLVCSPLVAGF